MKKTISVLICLVFMLVCLYCPSYADRDGEQQAIANLQEYLRNIAKPDLVILNKSIQYWEKNANKVLDFAFLDYCNVLKAIEEKDYPTVSFLLANLRNASIKQIVETYIQQLNHTPIGTVDELYHYANGRIAQEKMDYITAAEHYSQSILFIDSYVNRNRAVQGIYRYFQTLVVNQEWQQAEQVAELLEGTYGFEGVKNVLLSAHDTSTDEDLIHVDTVSQQPVTYTPQPTTPTPGPTQAPYREVSVKCANTYDQWFELVIFDTYSKVFEIYYDRGYGSSVEDWVLVGYSDDVLDDADLIPDKTYQFKLVDDNGYTVYAKQKLPSHGAHYDGQSIASVKPYDLKFSAKQILKKVKAEDYFTLYQVSFTHRFPTSPTQILYTLKTVLTAPNGYAEVDEYDDCWQGESWFCGGGQDYFAHLYQYYGTIPTGEYTLSVYLDNHFAASKKFTIGN